MHAYKIHLSRPPTRALAHKETQTKITPDMGTTVTSNQFRLLCFWKVFTIQ